MVGTRIVTLLQAHTSKDSGDTWSSLGAQVPEVSDMQAVQVYDAGRDANRYSHSAVTSTQAIVVRKKPR